MSNCLFCYKKTDDRTYHQACAKKFFGNTELPTLHLDNALIQSLAEQTINQRIAVTGVQPKLSLTLDQQKGNNRLTIVGLWGEYILKPQHPLYPVMPETEDLTMHLAQLFKIPVCDHTLLPACDGSLVYIARRFDRVGGKKVHIEDLCQLSQLLTENKYKSSYEKAGKLVAQYCYKGIDKLNFFELVLFCYLSGNNDMHLKNFSVIHQPEGAVLSPAYDLLNVNLVNPKDKEEMALTLNGKKARIKLSDFEELAQSLQIDPKVYQNSFKRFNAKNTAVNDLIERSFLSPKQQKAFKEIWIRKQQLFSD